MPELDEDLDRDVRMDISRPPHSHRKSLRYI